MSTSNSNTSSRNNVMKSTDNNLLSASLNTDSISNDNRAPQNTKYRVKDVVDLTNDNSVVKQLYPVFHNDAPTGSQYQEKDIHSERSNVFGHDKFRAGQEEVIVEAMAGRDVFVLMPTGGGKSLCYQLPAWCSFGLSVIISPLISLIEDQVDAMNGIGIKAVFLNSTTPQQHIISELQNPALNGGIKLLYITPEKLYRSELVNGLVKDLCYRGMVSRFVVDEVHCLSEWGHDFRPDYAKLRDLRTNYPKVPIMALTATASSKVVDDCTNTLGLANPLVYRSSFNRSNLRYSVQLKDSKTNASIASRIASTPGSGIIFCITRKDCEKVCKDISKILLNNHNCSKRISYYHSGLSPHEKTIRHREWANGSIQVLCATSAFGMGVDKGNVRFVIHHSLPASITQYYQESGRAGRDGDGAECILYYSFNDKDIWKVMINSSRGTMMTRESKITDLYSCVRYCEDPFVCRRTKLLSHFGETFPQSSCGRTCDYCISGVIGEPKDMSNDARTLLKLLQSLEDQRNGYGITLTLLSELWRGTKAVSMTKYITLSTLVGYGNGSKYVKKETDRIAHTLVLEGILRETSQVNGSGYPATYVSRGVNANALEQGKYEVTMNFGVKKDVRGVTSKGRSSESRKKSSTEESKKRKDTARSGREEKKRRKGSNKSKKKNKKKKKKKEDIVDLSIDSEDDVESGLPKKHAKKLFSRLSKLHDAWVEEETMSNPDDFCWNLFSSNTIRNISSRLPTSKGGLVLCGVTEDVLGDYGDRIIRIVTSYINQHNLQMYVDKVESEDEFEDGIDYSAIKLPAPISNKSIETICIDSDDDEELAAMEIPE